jgi:hypothetical protein
VTGDRGLAQMQRLRRPCQVTELRHGNERTQVSKIHFSPLKPSCSREMGDIGALHHLISMASTLLMKTHPDSWLDSFADLGHTVACRPQVKVYYIVISKISVITDANRARTPSRSPQCSRGPINDSVTHHDTQYNGELLQCTNSNRQCPMSIESCRVRSPKIHGWRAKLPCH